MGATDEAAAAHAEIGRREIVRRRKRHHFEQNRTLPDHNVERLRIRVIDVTVELRWECDRFAWVARATGCTGSVGDEEPDQEKLTPLLRLALSETGSATFHWFGVRLVDVGG